MPVSLSIACLSQKGGVGKSTLSRLIARTYAAAEWRVKIADFNPKQKTSVDWVALRLEQGVTPEIAAEAFNSVKTALKQDYDLMVFDGRPDSEPTTLEIAKEADLIVLPSGVSLDDMKPQVLFAHELRARGIDAKKIMFVINKTADSQVAIADAHRYLSDAGYKVAKNDLPMKTGYQIAQNSGRAVSETGFPTLNERAEALAGEIVARATELTGE
ncbi:chromosome partitioning protein [Faunimonas pinastri]|uniref:Chromosome partitioning protein n=1 Tax=Faunimonas pinastri TaxID=1855383 RepID=A0A1H9MU57_9HYPH|nr:ParA family protein [Faunimonas pinastri]SER26663.1 chromosome partitioning protein [Faunimonas pinastri]